MSRNSLSVRISTLRAMNAALLSAAELPIADALAAVRTTTNAAEEAADKAQARVDGSRQALRLVKEVGANSTDSAVVDAVKAAEAECTAADFAYREADANFHAAREALKVVESPVEVYLTIQLAIEDLFVQPDGRLEDGAGIVARWAAQAVAEAKSKYTLIAEAEEEVRRAANASGEASEASRQADRANRQMQRAYSLSATESNRLAAAATQQRWEAATSVEATASEASSAAHVAHEAALRLVKGQLDLLHVAQTLMRDAASIDLGVRRAAEAEAAQAEYDARERPYQYDRDQCTCSETSEVSCSYCRGLQDRISNRERDSDPCR